MDSVYLTYRDSVYSNLNGDRSGVMEIADELTFEVPSARFDKRVRAGFWDGKIRLVNGLTGDVYTGLSRTIEKFCAEHDIPFRLDGDGFLSQPFSGKEAVEFIKSLNLPFVPHDYQYKAFLDAIRHKRGIFLSPTSSGKTLIMYLIARYLNLKTLMIVPTIGLVTQGVKDFASYGYEDEVHEIFAGQDKNSDCLFNISTWQSVYKLPKSFFDQFDVIIGDEAHLWEAKSFQELMKKTVNAEYKIGLTGSLTGAKVHELVLTGLFGPVRKTITTAEMIDRGISSDIRIKVIVFNYPKVVIDYLKKKFPVGKHTDADGNVVEHKGMEYRDEVEFILAYPERNKFIKNLILSLEGNTVVLYHRVKDHGDVLRKMLEDTKALPVFNIQGNVKKDAREAIRQQIEVIDKSVTFASSKAFATGTSINNIQNVILIQPLASRVNNLQSIGRGLRKDGKTNVVNLFDLADNIPIYKKPRLNFLIKHALIRMKLYAEQKFSFKQYNVGLK